MPRVGAVVWMGLAMLGAGCDLDDPFEDGQSEDTSCGDSIPPNLSGTWNLQGDGERTGCYDERLDGSFSLRTDGKLRVLQETQNPGTTNAFTLEAPMMNVSLFGDVEGACMKATFEETTSIGRVTYRFEGKGSSARSISGTFTGTGPEGCTSKGVFLLQVTDPPAPPAN